MKYIESWLTGLGLESILPKLEANGINTPKKLAALSLRGMYEIVGVEDAEDRKKLYFLVQRLQKILSSKADSSAVADAGESAGGSGGLRADNAENEDLLAVSNAVQSSTAAASATSGVDVRTGKPSGIQPTRKVNRRGMAERAAPLASPDPPPVPPRTYGRAASPPLPVDRGEEMKERSKEDPLASTGDSVLSEEDLRVLRRRPSASSAAAHQQQAGSTSASRPGHDPYDRPIRSSAGAGAVASGSMSGPTRSEDPVAPRPRSSAGRPMSASVHSSLGSSNSSPRSSLDGGAAESSGASGKSSNLLRFKDRDSGLLKMAGVGGAAAPMSLRRSGSGNRLSSSVDGPIGRVNTNPAAAAPVPKAAPTTAAAINANAELSARPAAASGQPSNVFSRLGAAAAAPGRPSARHPKDKELASSSSASAMETLPLPAAQIVRPATAAAATAASAAVPPAVPTRHRINPTTRVPTSPRQPSPILHRDKLRSSSTPPDSPPPDPPSASASDGSDDDRISSRSRSRSSSMGLGNSPTPTHAMQGVHIAEERGTDVPGSEDIAPMDMAIRVVVRKRPISKSESNRGDHDVMEVNPAGEILMHEPKTRVDLTKVVETSSFTFDDAFNEYDDNSVIYRRTVLPLVGFAFEGGKASCFAYGQTGSGKTHTLMGSDPENPSSNENSASSGLYVLAARDIFAMLKLPEYASLQLSVSCFEIYGGKLFDLLNERNVIKCLEDARGNVCTPGLTEIILTDVDSLLDSVSTAHAYRSTGCTGANETSSRSHLVMHLVLKYTKATPAEGVSAKGAAEKRRSTFRDLSKGVEGSEEHSRVHGKLTFIDLAGSERGADTKNNSKQTRLEGAEINTSLLALKEVIRALANRALLKRGIWAPKQGHTPFRGSKLTQVLKDSLVGDMARTCMVACVSPAHSNCEHTLNTLRYADRVKEHQSGNEADGEEGMGGGGANVEAPDGGMAPRVRRRSLGEADSTTSPMRKAAAVELRRPSTGQVASARRDLSPCGSGSGAGTGTGTGAEQKRPATASGRVAIPAPYNSPGRIPRPSTSGGGGTGNGAAAAMRRSDPPRRQSSAGGGGGAPVPQAGPPRGKGTSPVRRGSPTAAAVAAAASASVSASASASPRSSTAGAATATNNDDGIAATASAGAAVTRAHITPLGRPRDNIGGGASAQLVEQQNDSAPNTPGGSSSKRLVRSSHGETADLTCTLSLLSAHKKSISDTVEGMKVEMELVKDMEDSGDRDLEHYMSTLDALLDSKERALGTLWDELKLFRAYRKRQAANQKA